MIYKIIITVSLLLSANLSHAQDGEKLSVYNDVLDATYMVYGQDNLSIDALIEIDELLKACYLVIDIKNVVVTKKEDTNDYFGLARSNISDIFSNTTINVYYYSVDVSFKNSTSISRVVRHIIELPKNANGYANQMHSSASFKDTKNNTCK
jgi:hypothetical protein